MQTTLAPSRSADWRAAIVAGFIAGGLFLVVNMALAGYYLGNAQLPL